MKNISFEQFKKESEMLELNPILASMIKGGTKTTEIDGAAGVSAASVVAMAGPASIMTPCKS